MLLLHAAECVLVTTASETSDTRFALVAFFKAIQRWRLTLFTIGKNAAIEKCISIFTLVARSTTINREHKRACAKQDQE
jgi:hypothetical protein